MNQVCAIFLAALATLLPAGAAFAQTSARVVSTTSWVEEWDPVAQAWVQVGDSVAAFETATYAVAPLSEQTTIHKVGNVTITETVRAEPMRFIAQSAQVHGQDSGFVYAGAQFGPFRVLDDTRAALVASTDAASVQAFAAMLSAYPRLETIEFADAPGTSNDLANLALGRAIRAAGLATHVPEGGSARSGAVELFLAGTRRTMAPRALFAVHSWRDERGREPADFPQDAPENRLYLDYYAEMGMGDEDARAFYAMTNSVPHAGALWLEGVDMARWITPRQPAGHDMPVLIDPLLNASLRFALARSGKVLADAVRLPWTSQRGLAADTPLSSQLAYADLDAMSLAPDDVPLIRARPLGTSRFATGQFGTALLDSGLAFP